MLRPQSSATREAISLDGLWKFALDDGEGGQWADSLDTDLEAPVPASYNDVFADPEIRDHVGWVWYQRTVRVPRGWSGQSIRLRFESATHEARVYVGGTMVAEHVGGYTPFEADVTTLAVPGEVIRITVGVNNELSKTTIPPGSVVTTEDGRRSQKYLHDFFNYAGLARSVSLFSVPTVAIEDITVVTDVDGTTGSVRYRVDGPHDAQVEVAVRDEHGHEVATARGVSGTLSIPEVNLWQPGNAYLYEFAARIVDNQEVIDEYVLPVGIRTVEVRGSEFLINGEPFYFRGFGKHEDSPVRGKGHDLAYMVHDFRLMEWAGANSFRTAHYPYAEEVLDYADRHGIVVIDETAAVGLNLAIGAGMSTGAKETTFGPGNFHDEIREVHAQAIRELIARDKNHPSVVMWCIANEPASFEAGALEYFQPLVELTRELDSTRPVTYANLVFASYDTDRIAHLFDVICLNRYYGWYADAGDLRSAEAHLETELQGWQGLGKPLVMTEYGADTLSGTHSVFAQPWTEEFQVDLLAMYHRVFDRIPALVGEQVWNFADFQTVSGAFRVDGNKKGIFTRDRRPKSSAHALRSRWLAHRDAELGGGQNVR
ncbi:beta-glucuronidase [Pseudoclavibacter sp. RFBJ3]|uniref:beta-glucuronidase n=1 Tax=unclassified Pseudoclavibacter TaxID=2615177 RepID=UPI000CE89860|nr:MULTISPECIES: beta-glucuronidase [unclassified Pseudoclavibacter]PPF80592.1 beta-glucuronidase [Pseudoclavibacter sp. RFBJ5]PPF90245.1 beta-glucuronidase [Pseudoclavibacter sp. RFBJ3]PPF94924.1 beta-glucuronidase [Pseudoclavibacter sp. RFBH5]PPG19051.1 beta-glucuronidase [Pseudoclavibacter sp. RFBI4]